MDLQKMQVIMSRRYQGDEEEDIPLPGFRFHPTDEELVGFYLRRKVDKKPIHIDLIKQIDIYKYDPWDLPKGSCDDVREKEWYFFCRRGRKYRNSIRPNRVTGSGFWKATGIDRPIYSSTVCIGLKKTLVYYRGSAGKGTKTEWMMHEFRLPNLNDHTKSINQMDDDDDKSLSHEAEVWTLCRILKRNVSQRKPLPDLKHLAAKTNVLLNVSSKTCNHDMQSCIRFQAPMNIQLNHGVNPFHQEHNYASKMNNQMTGTAMAMGPLIISTTVASDQAPSASSSCFSDQDMNEITKQGEWDDLRSIVEFASSDQSVFFM